MLKTMQRAQRQAAAFGFLQWLEASYGGGLRELAAVAGPSKVEVLDGRRKSNPLNASVLDKLFRHEVCAVHVRGYFGKEASEQLARHMLGMETRNWTVNSSASQKGMESSDVQSVGLPYNVALSQGSEDAIDEYFECARQTERELRRYVCAKRRRGKRTTRGPRGPELTFSGNTTTPALATTRTSRPSPL